jgi:hypothetical protein
MRSAARKQAKTLLRRRKSRTRRNSPQATRQARTRSS